MLQYLYTTWRAPLRFVYIQDEYDDNQSKDAQDGGKDEHQRVARAGPM